MTKNIVWGDKPFAKNGESPTHKIMSLYILDYDIVQVSCEKPSGQVGTIKISMEMAEEIGFINFSALNKVLK